MSFAAPTRTDINNINNTEQNNNSTRAAASDDDRPQLIQSTDENKSSSTSPVAVKEKDDEQAAATGGGGGGRLLSRCGGDPAGALDEEPSALLCQMLLGRPIFGLMPMSMYVLAPSQQNNKRRISPGGERPSYGPSSPMRPKQQQQQKKENPNQQRPTADNNEPAVTGPSLTESADEGQLKEKNSQEADAPLPPALVDLPRAQQALRVERKKRQYLRHDPYYNGEPYYGDYDYPPHHRSNNYNYNDDDAGGGYDADITIIV